MLAQPWWVFPASVLASSGGIAGLLALDLLLHQRAITRFAGDLTGSIDERQFLRRMPPQQFRLITRHVVSFRFLFFLRSAEDHSRQRLHTILLWLLDHTFHDLCPSQKILRTNIVLEFLFKQNGVDSQPWHLADPALEFVNKSALFLGAILHFGETHDYIMRV